MLTHAASCFSTSMSARRSATARSGTLVNTNSVLMEYSLLHGWVSELHAEPMLHPRIVEPPRLAHERIDLGTHARRYERSRKARRARQAMTIGDEVHPVCHQELAVVGRVVDARRGVQLER